LSGTHLSISRRAAAVVSALGLAATALLVSQAQAAPAHDPDGSGTAADARTAMLDATAVTRDLGSTTAAGTYLDGDTMVVNVTDRSAFESVRDAGATPRLVEHSTAALDRVTDVIDRRTDIVGTAWGIDPTTNQVFVQADQSVSKAELARLASVTDRFGDMVTVDRIPGRITTTISGGDAIWGSQGRCSLGFHVTDGASNYFLTAGHCTDIISSWYADQGLTQHVGDTVDGSFPGDDYGLSTMVADGGSGDVNLYDGSYQDITAARDAVVNETVYRSGSTTGLHSGTVLATDVSVSYPEGTVDGLIQTDVCAEPGDSGGSLFSGSDAIGLTSGGSGNCSFGGQTFFQPVTEALSVYSMSVY
jgi:Alpha-lytic protease prodomain/Trypsin